ncbi:MAG: hypothetical protein UV59_C0006G0077 [Candidatus Gottesmanbacteria bacterium GW2011_GWA1_43_11]|uniref:Uncharacterized protein n=1 Tax=Candidatus Gottesmanbacteria bacterium GW2011_GWA1_43_11 TaxID=1618436 RepID=A0A0G1ERE3_9BACT|nr:MAG: hypothetical protein UV59_C0006G0077 [Candidatus Gottesmanbacteria bacterium GW2011_GWA1_43_11]
MTTLTGGQFGAVLMILIAILLMIVFVYFVAREK